MEIIPRSEGIIKRAESFQHSRPILREMSRRKKITHRIKKKISVRKERINKDNRIPYFSYP